MKYTKETFRSTLAFVLTMALVASFAILSWSTNTKTADAAAGQILILDTTVSGGTNSLEAKEIGTLAGKSAVLVTVAQWGSMTTADFASYDAIVLGDPHCRSGTSAIAAAMANKNVWGPAVTGNVILIGTDTEWHASFGDGNRELVTKKGIAFAADVAGKTGAFITLSCYYHGTAANTPVPLLDTLSSFGNFTMRGVGCFNNAHIVATHPALTGITDAILSNWSCSVHEAFDAWPADYQVLAIAMGIGASLTPHLTELPVHRISWLAVRI